MTSHPRLLRSLLSCVIAVLLVAGCGSGDGSGDGGGDGASTSSTSDDPRSATEPGSGPDPDDEAEPTRVPDPVPAGDLPPIVVTSPQSLGYVADAFFLSGSALVPGGDLRWAILDAELEPMASGRFEASCDAPCRGAFRTRVPLDDVAVGSWELHVWTPPVADGDPPRLHDTMVPITVTDEPVAGTPPPGAEPPGGVPSPAVPAGPTG